MPTSKIPELRAAIRTATNRRERLAALLALADMLSNNDPAEMLALAGESLAIAGELGDEHLMAEGLRLMGLANLQLANYQESLEQFERSDGLYRRVGDMAGIAKAMGGMGIVYRNLGKFEKALEYYHSALALDEESGDRRGIAREKGNIGVVYGNLGEYDRALEYYYSALALHEELGDRRNAAIQTGNIGAVFRDLGEYDRALEHYCLALALHEELGDRLGVARQTGNIGVVYRELDEHARALEYHQAALVLSEELGNRRNVAIQTGNVGGVHEYLGEYARALEKYRAALVLSEELGDLKNVAYWTAAVGHLYATAAFDGYDPISAEDLLLRAIDLTTDVGDRSLLLDVHQWLAELYRQQEKWKLSYEHLAKSHELKENVRSHEAYKQAQQFEHRRQIAEMEQRRAVEQADARAAQLRAQLLETQLERKQQELASTAMHLAKQSELLGRFRNDLRSIMGENSDPGAIIKQFKEKLKELPCEAIDWTKFEAEFQGTYPEFRTKLMERFPGLTKMEVRICTLLKLRLTSLDVANLLCLSERSVEWHRLNVRRKLNLTREQDVYEALAGV